MGRVKGGGYSHGAEATHDLARERQGGVRGERRFRGGRRGRVEYEGVKRDRGGERRGRG